MPSTENLTTLSNSKDETLVINEKGEYNQQFHGFKAWMDPFLNLCGKKLSNSSIEILRKNKQLQY